MSRIICQRIRRFATKAEKRAEAMKILNYETKALYGAVVRNGKDFGGKPAAPIPAPENSSEIYWLVQHKQDLPGQSDTTPRKGKTTPGIASIADTLKQLRPNIPPPTATAIEPVAIPFSNRGLKSILKYPLVVNPTEAVLLETGTYETTRLPSVGKILQATMSEAARKALIKWKLDKIQELGEEGFNQLQQEQLNQGKLFHKTLEIYFATGNPPDSDSDGYKVWQSVTPALETLQPQVQFTEKMIEHPSLKYRGIVDCVSTIGSETAVIEWKKSEKLKPSINSTYDAPLQLCAYLGALSADPRFNLTATKGFVVVAYTDGQPAQVHRMDGTALNKYWRLWLQRVQEFWIRTRDGTLPEPI